MSEACVTGYPPDYYSGLSVTVMGLGKFGGQLAAVKFLVGQGARVTVTDVADAGCLESSLEEIKNLPVTLHLGGHVESDFIDTDMVVVSPAVPKNSRYLRLAIKNGISITTEINLFLDRCPAKVIGITGTTGKSTTTAMIGHLLIAAKNSPQSGTITYENVWVGGNIGRSLLEDLPRIKPADVVVLELSSFQLEDLGQIEYSPQIALITNVSANHLDRHETLDAYLQAKANITRFQDQDDILITNTADELSARILDSKPQAVAQWRFCGSVEVLASPGVGVIERDNQHWFAADLNGQQQLICPVEKLPLPGAHNVQNAAAAMTAALTVDVPIDTIAASLEGLQNLPDRLEFVADVRGVKYYNDSKSTTPQAGIVALNAFSSPIIAIVGGYDKSILLDDFARQLATCAKAVICIGQTAAHLMDLIVKYTSSDSKIQLADSQTLHEAVDLAAHLAAAGDVVLLSPACASWDMFENYQHRGREFKQAVAKLAKQTPTYEKV